MKRSRLLAVVPILIGSLFVGGTAFASPDHAPRHNRTASSVDHHSTDRTSSSSSNTTSTNDTPSPDAVPHR